MVTLNHLLQSNILRELMGSIGQLVHITGRILFAIVWGSAFSSVRSFGGRRSCQTESPVKNSVQLWPNKQGKSSFKKASCCQNVFFSKFKKVSIWHLVRTLLSTGCTWKTLRADHTMLLRLMFGIQWNFFLIFVITLKGLEPAIQPPLALETRMLPQCQQDTCEWQDL